VVALNDIDAPTDARTARLAQEIGLAVLAVLRRLHQEEGLAAGLAALLATKSRAEIASALPDRALTAALAPEAAAAELPDMALTAALAPAAAAAPLSPPRAAWEPAVGDHVGTFIVVAPLDRSGNRQRLRGRDLRTKAEVVLHVFDRDICTDLAGFTRWQLRLDRLCALQHQHLVGVLAHGIHAGHPWVASESVPGRTLADLAARGGSLPEADVLRLTEQVAQGVLHLHDRSLWLPGQLVPEAVVLALTGNAEIAEDGTHEGAKLAGYFLPPAAAPVTLRYSAPESTATTSVAGDIYALGAILHHLLTGTPPAAGWTDAGGPASTVGLLAGRHPQTVRVLALTLAQDPVQRFLTYQGFLVACRKAAEAVSGGERKSIRILRRGLDRDALSRARDVSEAGLAIAPELADLPEPAETPSVGRDDPAPTGAPIEQVTTRIIARYLASRLEARAPSAGTRPRLVVEAWDGSGLRRSQLPPPGSGISPPPRPAPVPDEGERLREISTRIVRQHRQRRARAAIPVRESPPGRRRRVVRHRSPGPLPSAAPSPGSVRRWSMAEPMRTLFGSRYPGWRYVMLVFALSLGCGIVLAKLLMAAFVRPE